MAFTACKTNKLPNTVTEHTTDTTEQVQDTTVVEQTDTTVQAALNVYADSIVTEAQQSRLENEYAYSFAEWDGRMLHHTLGIWPNARLTVRVPKYYKITRTITRTITKTEYKEKPVEVEKKLSRWKKFCADFFLPSFVLDMVLVVVIMRKERKNSL
jgi:hypothetical protein